MSYDKNIIGGIKISFSSIASEKIKKPPDAVADVPSGFQYVKHLFVIEKCGIFDICHMCLVRVTGKDAFGRRKPEGDYRREALFGF